MIDVDVLCKEYLEIKKGEVRSISFDKYETTMNNYLLPFLKNNPIETLDNDMISKYLNELLKNGLSQSTVRVVKITLKGLYNYAEKKYTLKHIDFSMIHVGNEEKPANVLDEYQEKNLYDYCRSHIDALGVTIILCLYGGLRFTEICALKYSDINLDDGYINVNKKVQRKINRNNTLSKTVFSTVELESPEKRKVALSSYIISYLESYMYHVDVDCYLLSNNLKLPEQRIYQRKLKDLGKELGFEVSYVILRNTCKEKCIHSNVDINTILNTLGISKLIISIDNNRNSDINYNQKQMDKLSPTYKASYEM